MAFKEPQMCLAAPTQTIQEFKYGAETNVTIPGLHDWRYMRVDLVEGRPVEIFHCRWCLMYQRITS